MSSFNIELLYKQSTYSKFPWPLRVFNFQAASFILHQQSNATKVGMGSNSSYFIVLEVTNRYTDEDPMLSTISITLGD